MIIMIKKYFGLDNVPNSTPLNINGGYKGVVL